MNPARGTIFTRTIKSLCVAQGDPQAAEAYAHGRNWPNARDVIESIKLTAVTPVGTGDYALPTPAAFDFAEFTRPMSILGKLPALRRALARVRSISATAGSGAYWAGEAQPRPISRMTFEGEVLEPLSVVAILVALLELLRSSDPNAESILSRDLAAAAIAAMDQAFIDPDNAGTPGVKPASISNGVTPIVSAGGSLANIDADLALLIEALSNAGSDLQFATFVMRPRTALYLAQLRGTGGAPAYPGMGVKGGTLLGLPAITSTGVPVEVGSPDAGLTSITLLDPSQVLLVDDGASALEVGKQTALGMSDTPGGTTNFVSLFQADAAAIKTTRYVNWKRCRDGMAQVLTGVGY